MELKGIEKGDILLLLNELNNQLEKLEADLHSSIDQFQKDWYVSQEHRLTQCGEKLTALENTMADLDQSGKDVRVNYPMSKMTSLELGV